MSRGRSISPQRRCVCGRFRRPKMQCAFCGPDKRRTSGHGREGALARAQTLTKDERRAIAITAAKARWNTTKGETT